jgi:hypothetical protein
VAIVLAIIIIIEGVIMVILLVGVGTVDAATLLPAIYGAY